MISVFRNIIYLAVLVALLPGCASITNYANIDPVFPELNQVHPNRPDQIDSRQPTFSWVSTKTGANTYDLIIYSGIQTGLIVTFGQEIYYKEGIQGTSHTIDISLEPESLYVWGVRESSGETKGVWSQFKYYHPYNQSKGWNLWWPFRTP